MTTKLSKLFVATSLVFAGAAMAEQTIGIQTVAATPASARARVAVSVVVPKIVILRVGAADATQSTVVFTVGVNPAVAGTPGDNLAYTAGAIPPVFATTIATTNPTTTAGVLVADAWTNATNNAQVTCALTAHPTAGYTAFAVGATAAGVPGTDSITVVGSVLGHPGTSLTGCTSAAAAPIAKLTTLTGTYTYGFTDAATAAAGSYGNTVTYTATTL
jgi:hypothetical protein